MEVVAEPTQMFLRVAKRNMQQEMGTSAYKVKGNSIRRMYENTDNER